MTFDVFGAARRYALPLAAVLCLGGLAAPADAGVVAGDTFGFMIGGFNQSDDAGIYLVGPSGYLTGTFGTTQTFTGGVFGGADLTVTSAETIANGVVTDSFSFSTPTNFIGAGTTLDNGHVIDELALELGVLDAGGNAVDLAGSAAGLRSTGAAKYGTTGTVSLNPTISLLNGGTGFGGYETLSTSSSAGLYQFGVHQFDISFSYTPVAAPAAVPEPTSWAMMIGGFGLIGGALRRGRRPVPAVA